MRGIGSLLIMLVAVFLQSCKDGATSMLSKSGGRPFDVLIVSNNRAAGQVVDSVLSTDVPCLPQSEPQFDTSLIDSTRLNATTRMARSIVIVTVNSSLFTQTRIRYEKNVWAKGQLVTHINTPNTAALRHDMLTIGSRLVSLLTRFELNLTIRGLSAASNLRADSMVTAVTGLRIHTPVALSSSKRGVGFLWLSDNGGSGLTNICVYTYGGLDASEARFRVARDSIMCVNIPGERAGMYMTTAQEPLLCTVKKVHQRPRTIVRGLWEMHSDAMGGPFVAHVMADTVHQRMVVAEVFVYAPGMKKRNLLRQAEAVLFTVSGD